MGLTHRRKTAKTLVDSRKNWPFLTVSRKYGGKQELTVKEFFSLDLLILREVLHSLTECVFYFPGTVTPYARYAKRL